jgi:hypothetical protein
MPKTKIVHPTSVHRRGDTRIFLKEVQTLAQCRQWSVILLVADGKGATVYEKDGISGKIVAVLQGKH